jgi:ribosomal protein S18 acetylase RimI-like enzyme
MSWGAGRPRWQDARMTVPPGVVRLSPADAGEVLTLQRAAYVPEAQHYRDFDLPPLVESLDDLRAVLAAPTTIALGIRDGGGDGLRDGAHTGTHAGERGRLVAAVRLRLDDAVAHLGRLVVAPDRQGEGLGSTLLGACEAVLPDGVRHVRLFTGADSGPTIRLYERFGYVRERETPEGDYRLVHLVKGV